MIKLKKLKILIAAFCFLFLIFNFVFATNIDPTYRWAWNDVIGWIDFGYSVGDVNVYSDRLEGYASSSVGYIALNCNSTPNGDICGTRDFKVFNNGNGYLSGWAYNDAIGWISFTCNHTNDGTSPPYNTNECITTNYGVTIDSPTGDFSDWAWNDIIGWISFNSVEGGGSINYKVKTAWFAQAATGTLVSSVFDSQVSGGAAINTIMWQGAANGGAVKFQIASSDNSDGPWNYYGLNGTSFDSDVYVPLGPNAPIEINPIQHNNKRYVRYKVILESDSTKTQSPTIDDIIINWSP